ncbi:MAG: antibiotic biosynthesis monooxygenase [Flavobacteriaceae bacterium]|nr:antibiotic biosynthesis monooxygenase [Flavobacteriaceae bacterium]
MQDTKSYYAVIFTSKQQEDESGYQKMADQMETLAKQQPGYIGIESAKEAIGITVSYWESLAAIKNWKENAAHLFSQEKGKSDWYSWYKVRICKVEREYEFGNTNL